MRACLIGAALLAALPVAAEPQNDALVGWEALSIPGWQGMVKRDPFTDEYESGMAFRDDVLVRCDPDREVTTAGLEVIFTGFPRLDVDRVDVEFRIGREEPQTGTWEATTGPGGSTVTAPDTLTASILRAGRIALRVQGHTRVHEWPNGGAVYEAMRTCAGPGR